MQKITISKGDGIGPEIMDATIAIMMAAGAQIEIEEIEAGEKVYLSGYRVANRLRGRSGRGPRSVRVRPGDGRRTRRRS